jgi:transcriptional regulator with XRE-family HTH domain/tetratricopeptide (TPR) repeat protein
MENGAWLRQQREARNWSQREMARRLIQAGRASGDNSMPSLDSMYRNVHRWERGETGLSERYRLYYCRALDIPAGQFGPQASTPVIAAQPVSSVNVSSAVSNLADSRLLASIAVAYRGIYGPDPGDFTVEREVAMAAHEASDHAQQRGIADTTLEQLRADVTRLARLSDTGEPLAVFFELRRVRDQIYRLQQRRLGPGETTDLYFLLGCINGLMGVAAIRLGYPDTAEELHRTGWAYAHALDHRPLMARLRRKLSSVAYVRGRFEQSRDLALSGLEYLSAGPGAADLHVNHARAAARLGEADAARQAVHDAHEAFDRDSNDELLEIGGEFVISKATLCCNAGDALTAAAGAEHEAAGELERAIGFYDEGPGEREEHWFAGKPLAGIDLAVVRLRSGALDAAAVALEPALSLPVPQRISDVTIRLAAVRDELAAPVFRGSAQARDLGGQIEDFGRETVVAGLHSLPGGPG